VGPFLAAIRVIDGPLPIVLWALAVLALLGLLLRPLPRGRRARWAVTALVAVAVGAGIGLATCWIVGDVMDVFDVTLSVGSRAWVAGAFAGIALAVVSLVQSRWVRRACALAAAVLFAVVGALGVNADFGQYPTLASIVGVSPFPDLPAADLATQTSSTGGAPDAWTAPADLPAHGIVGSVTIPATQSHFAARQALVYLPPAALMPDPPALPVLVMLSGQPGSPENLFVAGHLASELNAFAQKHSGLAPIVVAPDQLSAPNVNPMCVDSAIGNSATYLTVDVPAWISTHLHVLAGPRGWGIGGFSQGGTCAIQLGSAHPELFGSLLDVSGEIQPKAGSPEHTVAAGFAGDAAAYERAKPLAILAAHAPYDDTVAVFAVGTLDTKYTPWIEQVTLAASRSGMHTTLFTSPGTAHDWYTVRYAFRNALPLFADKWGIGG
jgi:S-formylglutathione hydrolase FrmB